jgi:hypothetical protein
VLACLVVLVLAVGGLLLWQGATARPCLAAGAGAPPMAPSAAPLGARRRAVRRKISRGAGVRRSFLSASRAPGLLCERAFPFHLRHADGRASRCARAVAPDAARSSPARC